MTDEPTQEEKADAKFVQENAPQTMTSPSSPYSELELQHLLTQPGYDSIAYHELMSYYTRDLRMGNLSRAWGEDVYVRYWLSFAGDLLRANMIKSFLAALARVADVIETSQSIGGFFRRRGGTITHEKIEKRADKPSGRNLTGGPRRR